MLLDRTQIFFNRTEMLAEGNGNTLALNGNVAELNRYIVE